jgi:hypothetical protein
MNTPRKIIIKGIQCVIEPDENGFGFIDISIEHPDGGIFGEPSIKVYYEWIVRGALDERSAIKLATRIVEAKLNGQRICHDAEGLIWLLVEPGESWKR